jgi:hypothetical protein
MRNSISENEIIKTFSSGKKLVMFEMNSNFINLIWADSDSEILSLSK